MDNENRLILVRQQIAKADKFLSQADAMRVQRLWDLAVNRYYYSCFHIVQALFISDGISAHTHAGVSNQFYTHYVKTDKVGIRYGSFIARLMQLRQKADYNCAYDITEMDVEDIVTLSHDFVNTVKSLIKNF